MPVTNETFEYRTCLQHPLCPSRQRTQLFLTLAKQGKKLEICEKNIFSLHRRAYAIKLFAVVMEQPALRNVNNYLNTNIYSYSETSGGQSSNLYLNVVHFLTPLLNRHLWQLKTVVFLHWYLICAVLLIPISHCQILSS